MCDPWIARFLIILVHKLLWFKGFSCNDVSQANPSAAGSRDIVKSGGGQTGSSWKQILSHLGEYMPELCLFENVLGLEQGTDMKTTLADLAQLGSSSS